MDKKHRIIAVLGLLGASALPVGDKIGEKIGQIEINQAIEDKTTEAAIAEVRLDVENCIKSGATNTIQLGLPRHGGKFIGQGEINTSWMTGRINGIISKEGGTDINPIYDVITCEGTQGSVFVGFRVDIDKDSTEPNNDVFIAFPIEVANNGSGKQFYLIHNYAGDAQVLVKDESKNGGFKSVQDITGSKNESKFLPLKDLENTVLDKSYAKMIQAEIDAYHGDINKLIKAYIDKLEVGDFTAGYENFYPLTSPAELEKMKIFTQNRIKPITANYLFNLYKYISKNSNDSNAKFHFVETIYRQFKMSPIRITPKKGAGTSGEHHPNTRNLIIGIDDEYSLRSADTLMHEMAHALTYNFDAKNPDLLKVQNIYIEGIARLTELVTGAKSRLFNPSSGDLRYFDFSLLTAAYLGKDDYIKAITQVHGFTNRVQSPQNPEYFIKKWKIRPEYLDDLSKVFTAANPVAGLTIIKVEKKVIDQLTDSGIRLYILREILKQHQISWQTFKFSVFKDFDITPPPNSIDQ